MPSNHARDVAHHLGEASNALERLTTENAALQAEVKRLKGEYDLACGLLNTSLDNERRLIEDAKQATTSACDGLSPEQAAALSASRLAGDHGECVSARGYGHFPEPLRVKIASRRTSPPLQFDAEEMRDWPCDPPVPDAQPAEGGRGDLLSDAQIQAIDCGISTLGCEDESEHPDYYSVCSWVCQLLKHAAAEKQRAEQAERERDEATERIAVLSHELAEARKDASEWREGFVNVKTALVQTGERLTKAERLLKHAARAFGDGGLAKEIEAFLQGERRATDEVPVPMEPRSGSAAKAVHRGPEVSGVQTDAEAQAVAPPPTAREQEDAATLLGREFYEQFEPDPWGHLSVVQELRTELAALRQKVAEGERLSAAVSEFEFRGEKIYCEANTSGSWVVSWYEGTSHCWTKRPKLLDALLTFVGRTFYAGVGGRRP